jgi:hypothetical protein
LGSLCIVSGRLCPTQTSHGEITYDDLTTVKYLSKDDALKTGMRGNDYIKILNENMATAVLNELIICK